MTIVSDAYMTVTCFELLRDWICRQAPDQADWLDERYAAFSRGANERDLHLFLGLAPRRLGK